MDSFYALAQFITAICVQAHLHIFRFINLIFCPNEEADFVCQDPIIIKNLCHGDATWTMWKKNIFWIVGSLRFVIYLNTS